MFFAALFIRARTRKQPKWPSRDKWIKKMYCSVIKKKILPFAATWIDLESINLSEINQRKKNTIMISFKWNLRKRTKKKRDKQTNNKTDLNIENWWLPEMRWVGDG